VHILGLCGSDSHHQIYPVSSLLIFDIGSAPEARQIFLPLLIGAACECQVKIKGLGTVGSVSSRVKLILVIGSESLSRDLKLV
jgi:hypothetical protein